MVALPDGKPSLPADQRIASRYAASNSNLDKPFRKIIQAAGLVPWPKLFQNLRASCETQRLKAGNRADLVANWIGHSVKVQNQNYVQQTDDDIELFNSNPAFSPGPESGPVDTGTDQKTLEDSGPKPKRNAETQCFPYSNLPWAGLEQTSKNTGFDDTGNAGGHAGGHIARFCDELTAAGFTPAQIQAIDSAMRSAGLMLVESANAGQ